MSDCLKQEWNCHPTRPLEHYIEPASPILLRILSTMSTAVVLKDALARAAVPVRGLGDGMEMDKPPATVESVAETPLKAPTPTRHGPRAPPPAPRAPPPGVLHLGKVGREVCTELEAVRIVVPRAAISHHIPSKGALREVRGEAAAQEEELPADPRKEIQDLKNALDKLQNSERRLLQDKEGLCNQLRVQTEVNRELKKLLVASVGDDLQYHFERMAREKNQLILENEALGLNLAQTTEQLERMSIQCDVWRSKFLASRVMAEELTNARVALQRQTREAQSAIQDLLREREEFSREMLQTHRSLEQLLVSLQWGRQQNYYPSAQPLSTGELAAANHKLADAVNSHLLGNIGSSSSLKSDLTSELCNTPAEKMAVKVLRILDPTSGLDSKFAGPLPESHPSTFLSNQKSIGRFHPYTRYENITYNCCERCSGELIVL